MASTYKNDPRWITARWAGVCAKSGVPFKKGDQIFYFPITKTVYAGEAAAQAAAEFDAAVADEDFYNNHP